MGWQGAISAGTALIGGMQGRRAARDQQRAAQQGLDFQRGVYGDAQGNLAPYMGAGTNALNGLNALMAGDYSGFETSPDYMYSRGEMVNGLDRSAASRGRLNAGGYPVELAGHLNGLASQNLGNYRGFLGNMAQMGQSSAMGLGQLGQSAAGNMMEGYSQLGQAQSLERGRTAGMWGGMLGAFGNQAGGGFGSAYGGGPQAPQQAPQPWGPSGWGG